MAQQLHALGEQVAFVAVLDHAGPDARVGWIDWVRWQLICLSQLEIRDRWRFVSDALRYRIRVNRKLPNLLRRIAAGSLDRNDGRRKATSRLRQLQASLEAIENYKVRPYSGRIDLFRAQLACAENSRRLLGRLESDRSGRRGGSRDPGPPHEHA